MLAPILPYILGVVASVGSIMGAAVNLCSHLNHGHCRRGEAVAASVQARVTSLLGRRQVGPCNVPQYNFDMCKAAAEGVTITSSLPAADGEFCTNTIRQGWKSDEKTLTVKSSRSLREHPLRVHGSRDCADRRLWWRWAGRAAVWLGLPPVDRPGAGSARDAVVVLAAIRWLV
jgi:hypothetical protein